MPKIVEAIYDEMVIQKAEELVTRPVRKFLKENGEALLSILMYLDSKTEIKQNSSQRF